MSSFSSKFRLGETADDDPSPLGGGYAISASDGHPAFIMQCLKRLAETGQDVVATVLEYGAFENI
jgi:hypothetical protein